VLGAGAPGAAAAAPPSATIKAIANSESVLVVETGKCSYLLSQPEGPTHDFLPAPPYLDETGVRCQRARGLL
jgi:hypothetical protein